MTVKIKYADFRIVTRSRTLPSRSTAARRWSRICLELVRGIFPLQKRVRLLGVSLHNLVSRRDLDEPQMTLEF